MQFMNSSLDKLAKNLSDDDIKYLTREVDSKSLELSKQKGAYPYEYMNSFQTFDEDKLHDRKCFYSSTKDGRTDDDNDDDDDDKKSDGHISLEDYLTCEKIWDVFGIPLLADVFETFIDTCLKFYRLDLCHYFSCPGLSWDAMLKVTGVKLEKISDTKKYLLVEKWLKVGISYIAKRYSKANEKYMKDYDPKKP